MKKECPCCGEVFECRSDDIMSCQCVYIHLTQEMRDYIAGNYDRCLCFPCLENIKNGFLKGVNEINKTNKVYK